MELQERSVAAWIGLGLAFALVLGTGIAGAAMGYETAYRNRLYPGVSAGGLKLDGFSREEARAALRDHVERSLEPGFRFHFPATGEVSPLRGGGGDAFDLPRGTIAIEDPDLSQDLVRYDVDAIVDAAYRIGRSRGVVGNGFERLALLVHRRSLDLRADFNRPLARIMLEREIHARSLLPSDADLHVSYATSTGALSVIVVPERAGRTGDVESALNTLEAQVRRMAFQPISVPTATILPRHKASQLEPLKARVPGFLTRARVSLLLEGKRFDMTTSTIAGWVHASATSNGPVLALDPDEVAAGLKPLVKNFLVEPVDGSFSLDENGTLKEFETPAEGIVVDGRQTGAALEAAMGRGAPTSSIFLARITPRLTGADAERLGIVELLGVGRSNFSGSPTNRRKNIALGGKKMNGVLIPPGEEFSQLRTLGPVDGAHGWLQELVIKENRTVPEYGGGLCQVGTTSFRAALAAGMPIVERRNHSYRVRYYEPAGMDATIYSPAPDFRFKNDTPHHLLITSQIQGDNLLFFVWGTNDGRASSSTKPIVYNIVSPPPKKLIPTTELPPGKTRCTESAHAGATASFEYSIAYADGTVKKETFTSYYRPWGAVCLVGATPEEVALSQSTVDETGINNPN